MSYANPYILSTSSQLQPDGETVFAYDIKMGEIQELTLSLRDYEQEQLLVFDNSGTVIGSAEANKNPFCAVFRLSPSLPVPFSSGTAISTLSL